MFDLPTVLAVAIPVGQGVAEGAAMFATGTAYRWQHAEWTFFAVNVPYWLLIIAGVAEHYLRPTLPGTSALALGALLGIAGIVIRLVGHFQLMGGFSPFVELTPGHQLVTTGIYRRVRHPMYLGMLLIIASIPTILAARWAWLLAAMAGGALVLRIRKEEAFLLRRLAAYREYVSRTWRLVPHVW